MLQDDSRPIRDASPFTGYCTGVNRLTGFPNGRNLTTQWWPSCRAPPPPPAPCPTIKTRSQCDPKRCTWNGTSTGGDVTFPPDFHHFWDFELGAWVYVGAVCGLLPFCAGKLANMCGCDVSTAIFWASGTARTHRLRLPRPRRQHARSSLESTTRAAPQQLPRPRRGRAARCAWRLPRARSACGLVRLDIATSNPTPRAATSGRAAGGTAASPTRR